MAIELKHDATIKIATGRSRKETSWKNREQSWSQLVNKLSKTHRTAESLTEYASSKKDRQDEIKDVGGFVGGYLIGGKRNKSSVLSRSILTLDADSGKLTIWDDYEMMYDSAACVYSTHKHTHENPRLRLVIRLDRDVSPEEYEAISRKVAGSLGINGFDDTTFEACRLMYWPSSSKDGDYFFRHMDGPAMCADKILDSYHNWRDSSEWPVSDRVDVLVQRELKKQEDPREKMGLIGAFCRSFDIHQAIDEFLSDDYSACDMDNRYTYKGGSTSGGLIVYDDLYAYSHHGTDPSGGKLCNAFDLVRIHKFGLQDEKCRADTTGINLPSFKAMQDFVSKNEVVRVCLASERLASINDDFGAYAESGNAGYVEPEEDDEDLDLEAEPEEELQDLDTSWTAKLESDKNGIIKSTIQNVQIILESDARLKGKFAYDDFVKQEVLTGRVPWRKVSAKKYSNMIDQDDAGLRLYLEVAYNINHKYNIKDAQDVVMINHKYHPIRNYLNGLVWDGTKRLDIMLVEFMAAEDSKYTRSVTRKTFVAAVKRIMKPGCKFDNVLVLVGPQGAYKSTMLKKLGMNWFGDSLNTVQGNKAYEQIQGVWIMEMAELSGLKRAEITAVKHFISKSEDQFRVAYGRRTQKFPRETIFIGTTNEEDFLQDPSGNRRFWPVKVLAKDVEPRLNAAENLPRELIDQYWAEAVSLYKGGETIYLDKETDILARVVQREHTEIDDRAGIIQAYLDTPLPEDWYNYELYARRNYFVSDQDERKDGKLFRDKISVAEIWVEALGLKISDVTPFNTKAIHGILKMQEGWRHNTNPVLVKGYGRQRVYYRKRLENTFGDFRLDKEDNLNDNNAQLLQEL